MSRLHRYRTPAKWASLACTALSAFSVGAQSQVLFSDDFSSGTIDGARWRQDARPFESGTSDIQASAASGTLEFSGTVTEQYWPGLTLATIPTFSASMQTNLVITVDRLAELGVGTASRSALFITDASRSNFVLFADVRGEGGWRYNRKIGQNGDSPNGSGVDIATFNDPAFDDGGFHQMKVVANGETVKLYVDNILGAEVAFPFTSGIAVQLGTFARATGDTAYTQFDNFQVAAAGAVSFAPESINVRKGESSGDVTVRIPSGANASQAFTVQVVSSDPTIAVPAGAQNGTLTLTFPAGGSNTQTFKIQGVKSGGAEFTLQSGNDLLVANKLAVNVPFGIGTLLQDTFEGPLNTDTWEVRQQGFETGTGNYDVSTSNGQLTIAGTVVEQYWAGASIRTKESYAASKDLPIVFEVDRVSMERTGTAGRSGIVISSADRSQFVSFAQNHGENGWTANVNPGNPTGGGTTLTALGALNDLGSHHLKLVADGETVSLYLDNVLGGTFPFPVQSGIHFEIAAYGRAIDDTIKATFDNARISTTLPCTAVDPADVTTEAGSNTRSFDVIIPRLLNDAVPATVTITSRDPQVAIPTGATGASLKLTFAAGATNRQTVNVTTVAPGLTTFDIVDDQGGCVTSPVAVTATPALLTLVSDDFSGSSVDPAKWVISDKGFETGTLTNSTVTQAGGEIRFHVTPGTDSWPGYSLATADTFDAHPNEPLIFEVDRVAQVGSGASTRTGVWITDATRANYVFFSYDDNNMGWQFNRQIGQAGDNPIEAGQNIPAFDGNTFNTGGNLRLKVIANGATAKFYINDVLGIEVPFPFSSGLRFEFGAYSRTVRDVVDAAFDNALLRGPMPCIRSDISSAEIPAGGTNVTVNVTIPKLLNATSEARVTVTSSNPSIAQPVGAANGALTLVYAPGGAVTQSIQVQRGSTGVAHLSFSTANGLCSLGDVTIAALATAKDLLTDNFDGSSLDTSKWVIDPAPFETGSVDGTLTFSGSSLDITATGVSNYWGGYGLTTKQGFTAGGANPLTFTIYRTYLIDNGSTGARSAFWILDSTGTNWVMFSDLTENGLGWTYNRRINQTGDVVTGGGVDMAALNGEIFDDRGQHQVRLVANGSTVRFYLDNVLGAEVPFPFSTGLRFRFGSYARAEFDLVNAGFDNATVTGSDAPASGASLQITQSAGQVTITWDGAGALESSTDLKTWTAVPNAASPYTVPASGTRFFRVKR